MPQSLSFQKGQGSPHSIDLSMSFLEPKEVLPYHLGRDKCLWHALQDQSLTKCEYSLKLSLQSTSINIWRLIIKLQKSPYPTGLQFPLGYRFATVL